MVNETDHQKRILGAGSKAKRDLRKTNRACLVPGCHNRAIKSHSQQRAAALKPISDKGKVVGANRDYMSSVIEGSEVLREYPIKLASRFWGFCQSHDNDLFNAIEDKPIDINCQGSLYLLFLRACCFELAQQRESSLYMELFYKHAKDLLNSDLKSSLEAEIAQRGTERHSEYVLEQLFTSYDQGDWASVSHKVLTISSVLGVSSSTTIGARDGDIREWDRNSKEPLPFFSFTTFPQAQFTHVVISWFTDWTDKISAFWNRYEDYSTPELLSELAFVRSEDALISPKLWCSLSAAQQREVAVSIRSKSHELTEYTGPNLFKMTNHSHDWQYVPSVTPRP